MNAKMQVGAAGGRTERVELVPSLSSLPPILSSFVAPSTQDQLPLE